MPTNDNNQAHKDAHDIVNRYTKSPAEAKAEQQLQAVLEMESSEKNGSNKLSRSTKIMFLALGILPAFLTIAIIAAPADDSFTSSPQVTQSASGGSDEVEDLSEPEASAEEYNPEEFNSQMEGNLTANDISGDIYDSSDFLSGHEDIYNIDVAQKVKYWSNSEKQELADMYLSISELAFATAGGTDSDIKPVIHIYAEDGTQIAHEGVFSDVMKVD
ncbi:hypothetical protein EQG49_12610 [Periweissella cryptocerci]|uniref:Uncharacterized protein n=1 Tax=Periweissella cryptocerci TaxID=2506420 RepID=A0A4P6YWG8_9LACO|nr:hypothetical protein [Periweissella cryptocerci]QBO37239.1 hypothetical protein EQG49_12610 [Periweissella cryptocerci]